MKQIVIINGGPKAGKKTFVKYTGEYLKVRWRNSIEPFKEVARKIGWTGTYIAADRSFLYTLKRASAKYFDWPFKWAENEIAEFYQSEDEVLFLSIREPLEIKKVKRAYPSTVTVLVTRPKLPRIQNPGDLGVNNYDYDLYVDNDGSELELKAYATRFASALIERERKRRKRKDELRYKGETAVKAEIL